MRRHRNRFVDDEACADDEGPGDVSEDEEENEDGDISRLICDDEDEEDTGAFPYNP